MERENKSAIGAGEVEVSEAKKEVGIRSGVGKVGRHQTVIDQLELAPLDNKVGTCTYLLSVESGKWKVESAKGGGSLEGRHFGTASLQAA